MDRAMERNTRLAIALLAALGLSRETGGEGGAAAPAPRAVLNEIHYHPAGDPEEEFIELHNPGEAALDLHGWSVRGGVRFRFDRERGPAAIPPGGFLLLARNRPAVARLAGIREEEVAGPYLGKLSNHGDRVVLAGPDGKEVESVEYGQDGAWPARADGLGASLQRVSPRAPAGRPGSWMVSTGLPAPSSRRVLLDDGAAVRWFENKDGSDPGFAGRRSFHEPDFDDGQSGWQDGRLAVGYALAGAPPWVRTGSTAMAGLHSILLRMRFDGPPDGSAFERLVLEIDADDGWVAWLNGEEIARESMAIGPGIEPGFDGGYLGD